ncbi:MAG: GNAT family N-acetyltransferase [Rhizobiaceae bacterium]
MPDIAFRPVGEADLALLRRWMEQPHWQQWWGDPEFEIGQIRDMVEGRDTTRPYIFREDGRDRGYIQSWTVADQLFEPWLSLAPWMLELPADAVGVDLSIGDSGDLSRGLGTAALSAFVRRLRAEGHRTIVIDPDPGNARAIRAYEKAGFRPIPGIRADDCLLMKFDPSTVSSPT